MIILQYYYYLKSTTEIIFKHIGFYDTQLTNTNSWYAKASNISNKTHFLSIICGFLTFRKLVC